MKLMKTLGLASAIAVAALTAQAQTTLRFAHPVAETDLQHTMALFFKEQVEERTGGSVSVQIFPQGQLGNDSAMIDGARSGIIDIVLVGLNNYTGLVPVAGVFELPFMFPARELAYQALDGDVGQGIAERFAEFGLTVLGFPENGFRTMTNSRGPIRVPADLAGINMRTNNSRALNDMFAALGANPLQLPIAELYTALETGVVNAQDHPVGIVLSFRYDEVQRYLTLTNHAYSALGMMMNQNRFNGLSASEQAVIQEVSAEAVAMQRQMAADNEAAMVAELEGRGMVVNSDIDAAAFQAAVTSVWDAFIADNGDAEVNAIMALQ
ncbi:MAG: DctP family TRAP transporter solute-binding subunit [Roseinatronobacter sp.]|jgi:tripartite ATP-independent transporter DctP family solute receptor|nr:DctP family TRAP transporter solute-binding subunit [Roseinatronobacter sp.]